MSKMQNVDFRDINEFLDYLPENELRITDLLRNLILECIPEIREKLTYNVPFYSGNYRICYIWPGAVDWAGKSHEGVSLGFCQGYLMQENEYRLDKGKRKQVYTKTYFDVREVDAEMVRACLYEALVVDQALGNPRKKLK